MFEKWLQRIKFLRSDLPFGSICLKRNQRGSLHSEIGPAYISPTRIMYYRDGKKHGLDADIFGSMQYYYMGVLVPPHFFTKPSAISIEEVLQHPNVEVRYVGLRILGLSALSEVGKLVDRVNSKIIKNRQWLYTIDKVFEFPLNILVVTNSTRESDGSYKKYLLCVPPEMKSCKEAVAWTFYETEESYNPLMQS